MPTLCFILLKFTLGQLEEHLLHSIINISPKRTQYNFFHFLERPLQHFLSIWKSENKCWPPISLSLSLSAFTYTIFIIKILHGKSFSTKLKLATSDARRSGKLQPKNNISRIFLQFYFCFSCFSIFPLPTLSLSHCFLCNSRGGKRTLGLLWQSKIKHIVTRVLYAMRLARTAVTVVC